MAGRLKDLAITKNETVDYRIFKKETVRAGTLLIANLAFWDSQLFSIIDKSPLTLSESVRNSLKEVQEDFTYEEYKDACLEMALVRVFATFEFYLSQALEDLYTDKNFGEQLFVSIRYSDIKHLSSPRDLKQAFIRAHARKIVSTGVGAVMDRIEKLSKKNNELKIEKADIEKFHKARLLRNLYLHHNGKVTDDFKKEFKGRTPTIRNKYHMTFNELLSYLESIRKVGSSINSASVSVINNFMLEAIRRRLLKENSYSETPLYDALVSANRS